MYKIENSRKAPRPSLVKMVVDKKIKIVALSLLSAINEQWYPKGTVGLRSMKLLNNVNGV